MKNFRNILFYFGLLCALTISKGDATVSVDCQKHRQRGNLELLLKEEPKRIVFNNIEVDSLRKVADSLLSTRTDSSDDYRAGVVCYDLAQLLNNDPNSNIGEFFRYLGNSRDSFLSAFEYYRNRNNTSNANESGINYLITGYSLLRNSLNAYQNNDFLKNAEEYKGRTDKKALDFWKKAAMFYIKFDEMYKGINGASFFKEVNSLRDDLNGVGNVGSYLKNSYLSGDSSSNLSMGWLKEIGFNASDVNYLGSDFVKLHQKLDGLKRYDEFSTSLEELKNYIKSKGEYNGGKR